MGLCLGLGRVGQAGRRLGEGVGPVARNRLALVEDPVRDCVRVRVRARVSVSVRVWVWVRVRVRRTCPR